MIKVICNIHFCWEKPTFGNKGMCNINSEWLLVCASPSVLLSCSFDKNIAISTNVHLLFYHFKSCIECFPHVKKMYHYGSVALRKLSFVKSANDNA